MITKFTCGEYTREHFRFECACGAVIAECKCDRPNKTLSIEPKACRECQKKKGRQKKETKK